MNPKPDVIVPEKEIPGKLAKFHPSPAMRIRLMNGEVITMNRATRRKNKNLIVI